MNSDKGKSLMRKPSWKNRKPPEVRQTLTSKYRLLKSNPILMKAVAQDDKEILLKQPLKTLATAMGNSNEINSLLESGSLISKLPSENDSLKSAPDFKNRLEILVRPKTSFNHSNSSKIDFTFGQLLSSTVLESRRESTKKIGLKAPANSGAKPKLNKPTTSKPNSSQAKLLPNLQNKSVRRSLSAEHFDRKKKEMFNQLRVVNPRPRKSQSSENLNKKNDQEQAIPNFSAITEEGSSFNTAPSTPKYKTPLTNERRSFFKTPNTTNRRSLFFLTPSSNEISEKLNEWLKRRGKSWGDFHHLKCFGLHSHQKVIDEENKENVEISPKNGSYEDLGIKPVEKKIVDLEAISKEALRDLHKLILEGYPYDQCDVWLRLIKQKYQKLEEDPQYWECRAAIEQSKGNINLAVECYKTAIVQGAEVQSVDKCLDQLLQKFSLLNINSQDGQAKDRARIIQDARNIFKSSIIQFAVQERTLKTKSNGVTIEEKKLIATPVRRSTRMSRTAYTSTPGIKMYASLNDVDDETKNSLTFRHNKALH